MDKKTEIIFTKNTDFSNSNHNNKSFLIEDLHSNILSNEMLKSQHIYFSVDFFLGKEFEEICLQNSYIKNIFDRTRIFFKFNENPLEKKLQIRDVRKKCAELISKKLLPSFIPIACYVENISEQIYALAFQANYILYDFDNECINSPFNAFVVENSRINRTIDPFFE